MQYKKSLIFVERQTEEISSCKTFSCLFCYIWTNFPSSVGLLLDVVVDKKIRLNVNVLKTHRLSGRMERGQQFLSLFFGYDWRNEETCLELSLFTSIKMESSRISIREELKKMAMAFTTHRSNWAQHWESKGFRPLLPSVVGTELRWGSALFFGVCVCAILQIADFCSGTFKMHF